jgi:hypothetical protein
MTLYGIPDSINIRRLGYRKYVGGRVKMDGTGKS